MVEGLADADLAAVGVWLASLIRTAAVRRRGNDRHRRIARRRRRAGRRSTRRARSATDGPEKATTP